MNQGKEMLADIPGVSVGDEQKAQALSPFELKNQLIDIATSAGHPFLNAGRGNPNFFNAPARLALCKLTEFAIAVSDPYPENGAIRFTPPKPEPGSNNLYDKFKAHFRDDPSEGAEFLLKAMDWAIDELALDADDLIYELTDAARGDFYPGAPTQNTPPRILANTQVIVNRYLEQVLLSDQGAPGKFDLFATEGATSAMVYVFNSLMENFILSKKDKVAVITPVFSPYLEIPALNDYEFDLVYINAKEADGWQIPQEEIDKLKDPQIKALYLINPTNPTSVALDADSLDRLHQVVQTVNRNLIILVDAVYATFAEGFRSIIDQMPYNCITVYSFSKYFGVTGWRLGVIMLNRTNVIDDMIQYVVNENGQKQKALALRYLIDSEHPSDLRFIDRLCLDSREVALGHTAGIACPGQAIMSLFCLYNLLYQSDYKGALRHILRTRINLLYEHWPVSPPGTDTDQDNEGRHTYYYALVDILEMARLNYKDAGFLSYLVQTFFPVDFVFQLAYQTSSVCLPGYGFFEREDMDDTRITPEDRNNWSIRVSLANLDTDSYSALGQNIMKILDAYYEKYQG